MKHIHIAVPEAAASGGTVTFRILVTLPSRDAPYPIFRTFAQVRWLQHRLQTNFPDHVIPPLPDPLTSRQIEEGVDQVEQKRIQIDRFLQRVCHRPEFESSDALTWFLGHEMTHLDSVEAKRGAMLGFLRFDNIIKPSYDRGLRIYKPAEDVPENDQGEFERRQGYVVGLEQMFVAVGDAGVELAKEREKLGECCQQLGDSTMEVLSSKFRLGDGQRIDNRDRHQALDQELQLFGVLMDDTQYLLQRQIKAEAFQFLDMIQEHRTMLQGLKTVMNLRTDRLSEYAAATKKVAKRQSQLEQANAKAISSGHGSSSNNSNGLGMHHNNSSGNVSSSSNSLNADHQQQQQTLTSDLVAAEKSKLSLQNAIVKLDEARNKFEASQGVVTRELVRFEKDRAKEWQGTIREYAGAQLGFEQDKLKGLETAWENIMKLRAATGTETRAGRPGITPSGSRKDLSTTMTFATPPSKKQELAGILPDYQGREPGIFGSEEIAPTTPTTMTASRGGFSDRLPTNSTTRQPATTSAAAAGKSAGSATGFMSTDYEVYTGGYGSAEDSSLPSMPRTDFAPISKISRSGSSSNKGLTNNNGLTEPSSSTVATGAATMAENSKPKKTEDPLLAATTPAGDVEPLSASSPLAQGYDPLMVQTGFS